VPQRRKSQRQDHCVIQIADTIDVQPLQAASAWLFAASLPHVWRSLFVVTPKTRRLHLATWQKDSDYKRMSQINWLQAKVSTQILYESIFSLHKARGPDLSTLPVIDIKAACMFRWQLTLA
jgi:hypothetical protein